jgi:hypothetical protein
LDQENPTPGNEGASIEDRLVKFLEAEEAPAQPKELTEAKAEGKAPETAEEASEKPEDGDPEQSQEPQLSTADLAKILGVDETTFDVDGDGNISVKTKIDGKEGAAKFADLLKTYQLQGHAENRAREVAEKEKALQARQQEAEQQFAQRMQQAENLHKFAISELTREFQSINWAALEQENPGHAALLRQKYQDRNTQLQNGLMAVEHNKRQQMAQAQAKQREDMQAQAARLPELIPEWKDDAVASKEREAIVQWAAKAGLSPQDVNLAKAEVIKLLHTAMKQSELQSARPAIENLVRKAPKIVKPGQAAVDSKAEKQQSLKRDVVKSGGKGGSLEAYLLATGKV